MDASDRLITEAENVMHLLRRYQIDAVVIGAVAMAAHHYVRQTHDLDLGVNAKLQTLKEIVPILIAEGYDAILHEPDGDDPLGGVIDVSGPFGLLQIVSFADRFPAVIDDAILASDLCVREGSPLRLIPIPHLVVLKLYAGGLKSKADIVELLSRNPDVDLDDIEMLCQKYRIRGFPEIRSEIEN